MKAMVQQRYGSSDWLELRDVAKPLVWGTDVQSLGFCHDIGASKRLESEKGHCGAARRDRPFDRFPAVSPAINVRTFKTSAMRFRL